MIVYPVATEHLNQPVSAVFITFAERAMVTAYPFAIGEKPLSHLKWFAKQFGDRPVILDSGIFTIVRDLVKNPKNANTSPVVYCDKYFELYKRVLDVVPEHWVLVEMDAHMFKEPRDKGTVEKYREWFKKNGYADRTLHVWHIREGGVAVFERYLKTYKRVAFSARDFSLWKVPVSAVHAVLRKVRPLCEGRHVHILGTATEEYVGRYPDNFTCDASSWNAVSLYGQTRAGVHKVGYNKAKRKLVMPGWVERKINDNMLRMMEIYRRHPEYTGNPVRVNYLKQLAAGLLVFQAHAEKLRAMGTVHQEKHRGKGHENRNAVAQERAQEAQEEGGTGGEARGRVQGLQAPGQTAHRRRTETDRPRQDPRQHVQLPQHEPVPP